MIDPAQVGTSLTLVVLMVTGIEIGIAFLMRGQRESSSDD